MTRTLSFAFGLLMVAAGAFHGDGMVLVASAVAAGAVVVALVIRVVATLAVMTTVMALALSEPSPMITVLAGVAAAAYLVLRHARGGNVAMTWPTVLGAVGLSAVAGAGSAIPLGLPWVPLVAPLAVVVIYLIVVAPLVS